MRHLIPFFFAAALVAPAQIVTFGVKAGVPLTEASYPSFQFDNGASVTDTGRWTVGPTVEFHLFKGLSLEVDALYHAYRRVSASAIQTINAGSNVTIPFSSSFNQDTRVWDLPVLFKYRFNARRVHPFVTGGLTESHESSDITSSLNCLGTADACNASDISKFVGTSRSNIGSWRGGATVGAGVEFKYGKIKIAPEFRYERDKGYPRNHATLLVGFTF